MEKTWRNSGASAKGARLQQCKFQAAVFASFGVQYLPSRIRRYLVKPYIRWTATLVRKKHVVICLFHIMLHLAVNLPIVASLLFSFTCVHEIMPFVLTELYAGLFALDISQSHLLERNIRQQLDLTGFPCFLCESPSAMIAYASAIALLTSYTYSI